MKIYNSLSRTKEEFKPIRADEVGMYVCGPTVYDEPHIGHARSAYIFDVIRRYFQYKKYKVTFIRNVTDVDDKIIDKARKGLAKGGGPAPSLEDACREVAEKYLGAYHMDMDALGISRPDKEPRATEYIKKMIVFIKGLIDSGKAYESGGDVYFDIKKARGYGKLSNQNLNKMESGARISPGEKKKDALDFALWKAAKEGEPSWSSEWGPGRPGWHIECSVMSSDILGDEFDIHGGGIDLIFPHHENEIAQSEGAGKAFARCWIHNGLLTINNEKMAKSLGNYITIKDFIARHKDADLLKLLFLSTHYRHPVDYTGEKIEEMKKVKERIDIFLRSVNEALEKFEGTYKTKPAIELQEYFITSLEDINIQKENFEKAMDDDFNAPQAMAEIFNIIHSGNLVKMSFNDCDNDRIRYVKLKRARDIVSNLINIFGLFSHEQGKTLQPTEERLINDRNHFRNIKDYTKADELRRILLNDYGIILEDTKDGTKSRRKI